GRSRIPAPDRQQGPTRTKRRGPGDRWGHCLARTALAARLFQRSLLGLPDPQHPAPPLPNELHGIATGRPTTGITAQGGGGVRRRSGAVSRDNPDRGGVVTSTVARRCCSARPEFFSPRAYGRGAARRCSAARSAVRRSSSEVVWSTWRIAAATARWPASS